MHLLTYFACIYESNVELITTLSLLCNVVCCYDRSRWCWPSASTLSSADSFFSILSPPTRWRNASRERPSTRRWRTKPSTRCGAYHPASAPLTINRYTITCMWTIHTHIGLHTYRLKNRHKTCNAVKMSVIKRQGSKRQFKSA